MNTKKYYPTTPDNVNFVKLEQEILAYWQQHKIFEQSVTNRPSKIANENNEFIFYDGPPFANGLPHYGHLLTGFIKDTYARYQTSIGKKVERRFGWDCHGLPAEMGAEKELGFSGQTAITEYGIDKFNAHCQKSVMKYSTKWQEYVTRQARWVDFENSYKTMDKNFMESVLWAFKELHQKGLIYQSMRVMPYSWACETPLSNFETRLDNAYRERADKSVTVTFKLKGELPNLPINCTECRILAWTTTPWTLPSNLALAVGAEIDYICLVKDNIGYIIAKFALENYQQELKLEPTDSYVTIKGKELENYQYEPIFPYFQKQKNAFRILNANFVTEGDGTGIVHIAPGFGEDDQILCQNHSIELVCPVDNAGKFTSEVDDLAGLQVFAANDLIIKKLKTSNNWLKTEQYVHNYPHCWRTDTPLIYKAVPSWYVKVTAIKDQMVELNKQINWIPSNVQDGLFGKWLENARDWSISRNRFWGTPIPVWQSDDAQYPRTDIYGSIAEIENDFDVKLEDLHRPFIDELIRPNPDDPTGKSIMRRIPDVFDCWFESGSMPYGQVHYPFENKEWFEQHFPADFIVEYSAQTRGWFYTLMVLSTALFNRPPFLNCICHGVILDTSGQKLSKRLNNYADPLVTFEQYGADALRVTMLASNVTKGQELLIDKDGKMIFDHIRLYIKPFWSAYNFFCLYANIDQVKAVEISNATNILDRYILAKLKITIINIRQFLDLFDSQSAYQAFSHFFEILNNWYIRRSRERFWQAEPNQDKIDAYNSLYSCLLNMSKAISPLLPLISEYIYLSLNQNIAGKSVHLTNFPDLKETIIDHDLVHIMDQVQDICSSALFIRNSKNIRVRQPLHNLTIITKNSTRFKNFASLIREEINVKTISYANNLEDYAKEKLSINFPLLGKRLPSKMKHIIEAVKAGNWQVIDHELHIVGEILLSEEYSLILQPRIDTKSNKTAKALSTQQGIIYLDTEISESLAKEGIVRDIIRLVQQARKDAKFNIEDRIELAIEADEYVLSAINAYQELICGQTLSKIKSLTNYDFVTEVKLSEHNLKLKLKQLG